MEKNKPITKKEKTEIFNAIAKYYSNFCVMGMLRNGMPGMFFGGNDENFTDVRASIVFAMKKDKRVEAIIRDCVRCFDETPTFEEFEKKDVGKDNN